MGVGQSIDDVGVLPGSPFVDQGGVADPIYLYYSGRGLNDLGTVQLSTLLRSNLKFDTEQPSGCMCRNRLFPHLINLMEV